MSRSRLNWDRERHHHPAAVITIAQPTLLALGGEICCRCKRPIGPGVPVTLDANRRMRHRRMCQP